MGELFRLVNKTQHYAWGSHETLAHMRGLSGPSDQPEAEVWVGAHPCAPSEIDIDGHKMSLDRVVENTPDRILPQGVENFPFLFKILAIDAPLSIQVHPTDAQAESGFDRENQEGIALDDSSRNYKDRHSKPETVIALTPMKILTGVRPDHEVQEIATAFGLSWLADLLPVNSGKELLAKIIRLSEGDAAVALEETLDGVRTWAKTHTGGPRTLERAAELVEYIEEKCPGDRGLLVAVVMNLLYLEPGDSAFTPDGQVHAYVSGTAIEIMNPSDNVLRAGLTPKHIDTQELIEVLRDDQYAPAVVRANPDDASVGKFSLWDERLSLTRIRVPASQAVDFTFEGTSTLLSVAGELTVESEQQSFTVYPTESLLHSGSDTAASIRGSGEAYVATYV